MGSKISIIIPVYNVEPYLRQCLESIINQTYQNLEIIAVDDGSPDYCGAICDEYAAKDERIRVIHKQNAGVSAARNDGMAAATGKWTMFMDSDDWLEPDFIESMRAAVPPETVDIVYAGGYIRESSASSERLYAFENQISDWNEKKKTYLCARTLVPYSRDPGHQNYATIATAWNKLFRTEFLQQSGVSFNTELHPQEDILFCLDVIAKASSFISTDYIGYHYRKGIETSALQRFNPNWPHMGDVFLSELEHFVDAWPEKEALQGALKERVVRFISQILRCYYFHPQNTIKQEKVKREWKEFRNKPIVKRVISSKMERKFTKFEKALCYLMRFPWIWPLKLVYTMKQTIRGQ